MTDRTSTLLEAALALPESERADLAAALLKSIEPTPDADVALAWREEVARRMERLESGASKTVPWAEVRDQLYSRLRAVSG